MAERREGMLAMVGADTGEAHTTKRHPAAHNTVSPGAATHMQPGGGKAYLWPTWNRVPFTVTPPAEVFWMIRSCHHAEWKSTHDSPTIHGHAGQACTSSYLHGLGV